MNKQKSKPNLAICLLEICLKNKAGLDVPLILRVCAVPKLKEEIFNPMLDSGADINGVDKHGQNALFKAAETGNLALLRALLEHGVNPMQCDEAGEIPLSAALRCGHPAAANCLLGVTRNPAEVIDNQGRNLLHKAACGDVSSVARLLVQIHKIPVESHDADGHTALHIAAHYGSIKMVKYLVKELNANVNAIDKEGRTPIFSGAYDANLPTLKLLCELGADLCWKDHQGMTVLQFASIRKEFEAEKLLESNLGLYRPKRPEVFVTAKPERCPVCGSTDVRPILYGKPTPDFNSSRHISGGCCITEKSPSWACKHCHAQFIKKRTKDEISQYKFDLAGIKVICDEKDKR